MKRLIYIIAVISTVLLPNAAFGITAPDLNAVIDHSVYNDPNTTVACTDNSNSTVSAAGGGLAANTTPSQKIAQTFIVGFDSATPNVKAIITDIVTKYRVGGIYIVNSQDHDAAAAGLNKAFFDTLTTASGGTPVTVASDEEGGQIHNYTYPSNFPSAAAMGTMSDTAVTGVGTMVGTQLATDGITEDLAPVLDINSGNLSTTGSTRNVIGSVGRSFSATPSVVATKASAFAKGVTGTGIDVTFKHFPGLGFGTGTNGNDSDHAKVTSPDISTLKTRDLIPYQTLITAYPNASIMMSNENVSGLDAAEPASVSPAVVSLLRNDYKFNGTITTDDLNTTSVLSQTGNLGAAVTKSLNAGVTRPLFGELGSTSATAEATLDSVLAAVTAGTQQATIDSAVTRVLAAKKPAISPVTGGAAATPAPAAAAAPGTVDSINGYKLPATTGQTGFEESVNVNGDVPSTGAPVSFPQYAKLGQAYRDYYVNMRWTFASWSWNGYSQMINQGEYDWMNTKPRLLVITNPKTGKSIIADAMETGPGPSVGSTWRAQHNNTSDVAPPYWQGFQTSTPAGYDGMVAGMPATAVAALGMTKATDIDPSYANGGVTTPLKFAWASDQNATPGPTTVTASGSNGSGSTASACCNTVTGQPSTGLSNVATSGTNSEKIFDFFRDNGATAAGAAGIVGNFTDESASNQSITPTGPDPTAQSSAGAGFHGIEKWSGDRWSGTSGLQAFAADKGGNWQDLTIQLNFSAFELGINTWTDKTGIRHDPPSWVVPGWAAANDPKFATDPKGAAMAFEQAAEGCIPGIYPCGFDIRQAQAQAAYDAFKSYTPKTIVTGSVPPTAGNTNGAPGSTITGNISNATPASSVCATGASTNSNGPAGSGTPTDIPQATCPSDTGGTETGPNPATETGAFNQVVVSYACPNYHPMYYFHMTAGYAAARIRAGKDGRYNAGSVNPGADCNEFVTTIIHDSGIDLNYNKQGMTTESLYTYMLSPASGWHSIGNVSDVDVKDLRPGDVALKQSHTFVYVGNIAGFNSNVASASLDERTGMAGGDHPGEAVFLWFRKN